MMKSLFKFHQFRLMCLVSIGFLLSCAELDQLTKPSVKGRVQSPSFDHSTLMAGAIKSVDIQIATPDPGISPNGLSQLLVASIREKRKELEVKPGGRYIVTATILSNNLAKRTEDLDAEVYKYVTRTVEVSYVVSDSEHENEDVWQGMIATSDETSAIYRRNSHQQEKDKIIEAVVESMTGAQFSPYPDPPDFSTVIQWNFEGFALNLPIE